MTLDEAMAIYAKPKKHTRDELHECLRILNAQPVELTDTQFLAIQDAKERLKTIDRPVTQPICYRWIEKMGLWVQ